MRAVDVGRFACGFKKEYGDWIEDARKLADRPVVGPYPCERWATRR